MSGFTLWLLIGLPITLFLGYMIIIRDVFEENTAKRNIGLPNKIVLGDTLGALTAFGIAIFLWPLAAMIVIGITWTEFSMADIVLWRKSEKPREEKVTALEKQAKELGLILTPKEITLKGVNDVGNRQAS